MRKKNPQKSVALSVLQSRNFGISRDKIFGFSRSRDIPASHDKRCTSLFCLRRSQRTQSKKVFKMALWKIVFLVLLQRVASLIHVTPNMKTFSYAMKNAVLDADVEKTLYEHNTGQPGVITEQV